MSKSSKPTPIALPNEMVDRIKEVCDRLQMSQQEVMRLSMRIGLEGLANINHDLVGIVNEAAKNNGVDFATWARDQKKALPKPPKIIQLNQHIDPAAKVAEEGTIYQSKNKKNSSQT